MYKTAFSLFVLNWRIQFINLSYILCWIFMTKKSQLYLMLDILKKITLNITIIDQPNLISTRSTFFRMPLYSSTASQSEWLQQSSWGDKNYLAARFPEQSNHIYITTNLSTIPKLPEYKKLGKSVEQKMTANLEALSFCFKIFVLSVKKSYSLTF